MKKIFVLGLTVLLVFGLAACKGKQPETQPLADSEESEEAGNVEITFWSFPVGEWGNPSAFSSLIADFHKEYPNIHVSVECLDYLTGDEKIQKALEEGSGPDLVLEGPERLRATWGSKGLMADLSDLWKEPYAKDIDTNVRNACIDEAGTSYIFPLCMGTHCMAINYDLFKAAGALQYIDEEKHTWSTDGFVKAVEALRAYGLENAAVVYCGGQGGDQGTRALVNNLYGGSFTDEAHTKYLVDSEENIRALQLLRDMEGIRFDPEIVADSEIDQFCKQDLGMAFCWNGALEILYTVREQKTDFKIFPMAFPTDSGDPRLQGGIWGLGIFDNGDSAKVEAAKKFIRYMNEDENRYTTAVQISNYWPVRDIGNIYENDALMTEYSIFNKYMGDFYQITPNWANARTAWWEMLQEVGGGTDISAAVKEFSEKVNNQAGEVKGE